MLYNYKNIDEKMIVVNKEELNKCQNGEIFTVGVFKTKKSVKPTLRELVEKLVVEVTNINKRIDKIDTRLDQHGLAILDINKRIDKIDARLDQNGLKPLVIDKQ
jgi:hypothetical protein